MSDHAPDSAPAAAPPAGAPPDADDRSVSMLAANVLALAMVLPVAAAAVWAFAALWGWGALNDGVDAWFDAWTALIGALVGGTLVHEMLHALAWRAMGVPRGRVRLGFSWRALTPYAHADVPMPARSYRIGAMTPGIAIGLIPLAFALVRGGPMLFWFGLLFTVAAGGDALILWLLRGVPPEAPVQDHPTRAGCLVLPAYDLAAASHPTEAPTSTPR